LQTVSGQPIIFDNEGLKEAEASYDSPVTRTAKGISLRTALRLTLAPLGLTYVIRDEAIYVTSAQRAKEMMVTRRYYVGDLLASMGGLNPSGSTSPFAPVTGSAGLPIIPIAGRSGLGGSPIVSQWSGFTTYFSPQPQVVVAQQQNADQSKQVIDQLKEMIMNSVDPNSWRDHGDHNGNGTIVFHAPSMSFIIRQSAEVHSILSAGLVK
jgi:hypothetical protein